MVAETFAVLHVDDCGELVVDLNLAVWVQNDSAIFVLPFKSVLKEFFPTDISFFNSTLTKHLNDLRFRGDGGMIRARYPTGVFAVLACLANEDVLDGVVEHMPHVQHARNVGRRDYNRERLAFVWYGAEVASAFPVLVPASFYLTVGISGGKVHGVGSAFEKRAQR